MSHIHPFLPLTLLLLTGAQAGDWPHWRGPNRDGTSPEDTGWERGAWPPREQWRANVGAGFTSPRSSLPSRSPLVLLAATSYTLLASFRLSDAVSRRL